ncbi:hypothetical protein M758_9G158100 [Ceratodon purpureus]|nr:hypothetical protein M758_9G158100 [Ceratodon purpureus]
MAPKRRVPGILAFLVTLVGLHLQCASGQSNDSQCLLSLKASVSDPQGKLSTWTNVSRICYWEGVWCFKNFDIPVYKLVLANFGLSGSWPAGLSQCNFLQTLDISYNAFTGPIPTSICDDIPNLVTLDAQHNKLGGFIPAGFGSCKYLNDVYLNDNQLEGEIPGEIALAPRLSHFTVANNDLSGIIPSTFNGQDGGMTHFNVSSFAGNTYLCGAPLTNACKTKPTSGKNSNLGAIIGGIVGVVLGILLLFGVLFWWFVKRSSSPAALAKAKAGGAMKLPKDGRWARRIRQQSSIMVAMFDNPVGRIMFTDLMTATNDFSESNVISTSPTGTVYKATFADGKTMAIKRLKVSSQNDRAFQAEMETLGRLKHRNLAPLLGFCVAAGERLLVYEHMPNGTIWDHLHPKISGAPALPWPERVRVATGAARGLAWLHHSCNPRVLHRNINSKSILLDSDNEPRISDFGLARLMDNSETHLSTFFNGDYGNVGYVAPEYMRTLTATTKNDIYGFGVVLLELLTGQKPVDVVLSNTSSFQGNLVEWVTSLSVTGNAVDAVDPTVKGSAVEDEEILRVLKVAISCVSAEPKERPSMFEVYQLLRAIGQKYDYTASFADLPDMEIWRKDADDGETKVESTASPGVEVAINVLT